MVETSFSFHYDAVLTSNASALILCLCLFPEGGAAMTSPPVHPRQRRWSQAEMEQRLVRYADLRPCYNAFIDTRSPGSEAKENFTIIGPGVSENPQQHVHIAEPHGFNIGGARQPPHCVNSQHSHESAETFVVHSGRWTFNLGEHGDAVRVEAGPGDFISQDCFEGSPTSAMRLVFCG
jgi:mannose-6-phosphate isomerase-like protein (cupin superfamily)